MDKELLIKELCSRLPNGVKVLDDMGRVYELTIGNSYLIDLFYGNGDYVRLPIKPYLRPMSSMTEDERNEYREVVEKDLQILKNSLDAPIAYTYADGMIVKGKPMFNEIDWLNAHHFDYRSLIEKGLALEAPEGMYKI